MQYVVGFAVLLIAVAVVTGSPMPLLPAFFAMLTAWNIWEIARDERLNGEAREAERRMAELREKALRDSLSEESGTSSIIGFWKGVDREMRRVPKVCRAGCSACCHQPIDLFPQEVDAIRGFIVDRLDDEQKAHVARQARAVMESFRATYE